ncbi:trehalose-phosphatase [Aurantiacibacter sp. MUD11]|uniref:trehalose-phosphatase n=1 Tax=Aurantiacibacter sp. MUD11 TaxID=3003265 RepID=UPI0022AA3624|nr:trehalose-phosphatase [Aurantiacibacter sp. MUD11]WAT18602.1 trehalose-phosphatase [Aurantiacibacter sp. MUD11]
MSAKPNPPALDALSGDGPIALFLDFDGTLVDIAPTPDGIAVPDNLSQRLTELSDRLGGRLALISGRALVDLQRHLGGFRLVAAGSHGVDCRAADGSSIGEEPAGMSAPLLEEVQVFVAEKGLTQEDKPHGAALHYRSDPSLEDEVLEFARRKADEHGLDLKRGKCVVELVAPGANKGAAVHRIMAEEPFTGARPVFIGDDVTDEDGMVAAQEYGGFGISVGERESAEAKYALASPAAVHHWLGL